MSSGCVVQWYLEGGVVELLEHDAPQVLAVGAIELLRGGHQDVVVEPIHLADAPQRLRGHRRVDVAVQHLRPELVLHQVRAP